MSIDLKAYITASGTYPERLKSKEWTPQIERNAVELLKRVNSLLKELGWTNPTVSSGFRPSDVNNAVSNAAKKSAHMTGEAIDILDDKKQTLALKCTKVMLEKYDLYREDSDATRGKNTNWVHLQTRRTGSGRRIFKP